MASIQSRGSDEEGIAREAFTRLAAAADEFEGYANPHAERIAALSIELAKLFGLGRADRASLRLAALAHDLGEMTMRRDYIRRAAPLTLEERLDLARHPVIGEQEAARAGADRGAQLLVRWHHEWWNGTGYPDALSRENIPLAARILRVPALTESAARQHLTEWAGLEFDPQVVRAFLTLNNLPALRSYARRADDAPQATLLTQAEPATVSGDNADEWNIGGHIPEKGESPYAGRVEESLPGASLDRAQNFDTDQSLENHSGSADFMKADTDRHA
jgi:HD-GYP domain-containing protein (c-di-GMP phosphodiesterase class II)